VPYRAGGWAMVAFGLFFGAAGVIPDGSGTHDWGAAVAMAIFGALCVSLGAALITARATVTPAGIRYRYGLVRRRIRTHDIKSISVGPGSGRYYPRICLQVGVRGRARPIRLIGLQRADTRTGHAALAAVAEEVRRALGAG
jgi:hypothetical protein